MHRIKMSFAYRNRSTIAAFLWWAVFWGVLLTGTLSFPYFVDIFSLPYQHALTVEMGLLTIMVGFGLYTTASFVSAAIKDHNHRRRAARA